MRILPLIGLLAALPAGAQSPPSTPPSPAPPVDWRIAMQSVANVDVLSPAGALVRQTHAITLGEPVRIVMRYSDLMGAERIVATFPGRKPVASSKVCARDLENNLAVLIPDGEVPPPPPPAGYIRWWFARVRVVPPPARGDTAAVEQVNQPLVLGKLRVIPLTGDYPSGLPVLDVQGGWIGITGQIQDATGSFTYVTGSEEVVPLLFGAQAEIPLSEVPQSYEWCAAAEAQGLLVRAVLRAQVKPDEAAPFFVLAAKRDSTMAEIPYWRGAVDFREQRYADAESSFVRAALLRPKWSLPLHMAGACANQEGHYQEALQYYDRALAIDPKSAMTLGNKAGALYNLHQVDETLKTLHEAIAADSSYAPAYQMLGATYVATGRTQEAEQVYQKLATLDTRLARSLRDLLDRRK